MAMILQKPSLVSNGGSGLLAPIAAGTWAAPGATSGATCSGTEPAAIGALCPLSAGLCSRLAVKHVVQEAKQFRNILKRKCDHRNLLVLPERKLIFQSSTHNYTLTIRQKQSKYPLSPRLYTHFFTDTSSLCQQSRICKGKGLIVSFLPSPRPSSFYYRKKPNSRCQRSGRLL